MPQNDLLRDGTDPEAEAEREKERANAGIKAISALFDDQGRRL